MTELPKLIGLHGKARSGKDTVGNFLVETYKDHYTESFAGPLKDAAAAAFGIPRNCFDEPELKEQSDDQWLVSPRKIAQFLGTEMFRDTVKNLIPNIGNNFWIERLERRLLNKYEPEDQGPWEPHFTCVITDVRFQNEYDWILSNGGIIIHLTRAGADGTVGILNHQSESDLSFHTPERNYKCANNGTISDLYRKVADIILSTKY